MNPLELEGSGSDLFCYLAGGSQKWRTAGSNFHFPTSPMTSRSSSCTHCTKHWTRAKLGSLKVQLERCVFTPAEQINTKYGVRFLKILMYISSIPGQVSESDMWSSELAHRPWGEEEAAGSSSASGRRSSSVHVHYTGLNHQLLSRAWLDHWFCSKKDWTRYGDKVEGNDVSVRIWDFLFNLFFFFQSILYCEYFVFVSQEDELKRKKREERLEMIRNNVHLKYAMKRKVGDLTLWF